MDSKTILIMLGIILVGYILYSYNIVEQKTALLLTGLVVAGYLIYDYYNATCKTCVQSHSQNGDDYVWLNELGHGKVDKVSFEEPVGSGNWRLYDDKWWETHCRVVDHNPNNLVNAHVNAFIDPSNRFAKMMFTFQDGTLMEPTKHFFELEQNYFKNIKHC